MQTETHSVAAFERAMHSATKRLNDARAEVLAITMRFVAAKVLTALPDATHLLYEYDGYTNLAPVDDDGNDVRDDTYGETEAWEEISDDVRGAMAELAFTSSGSDWNDYVIPLGETYGSPFSYPDGLDVDEQSGRITRAMLNLRSMLGVRVGDVVTRGKGSTLYEVTGFWEASGARMVSLMPVSGYTSASAPLKNVTVHAARGEA